MRVFLAGCFSDDIRKKLAMCAAILKSHASGGTFVPVNNYHFTLVFIGETQNPKKIISAMNRVRTEPFALTLDKAGYFSRPDGAVCWIGIKENQTLQTLYTSLCSELSACGFCIGRRPYRPHITLARRVHFQKELDQSAYSALLPIANTPVEKMHLMKSERIGEQMVYTPIYTKELSTYAGGI